VGGEAMQGGMGWIQVYFAGEAQWGLVENNCPDIQKPFKALICWSNNSMSKNLLWLERVRQSSSARNLIPKASVERWDLLGGWVLVNVLMQLAWEMVEFP
jgi:hypothetical protein